MQATNTNTLKVPGANLYYEVRGSGPVLLLICGGVYDAAGYAALAEQLADRYTVVTYDRRGNSRSPLDGPPEHQRIEVHGDDAHRVLVAVGVTGGEPAHVFGNSSGATIGFELAARHPEQVRTLVAHEPPAFELLSDRDHWRTVIQGVEDAFRKEGAGPAMQVLGAGFAMSAGAQPDGDATASREGRLPGGGPAPHGEPDPETIALMARLEKNMEFFIGYEVPPFNRYIPDIDALRASPAHVVMAVGEASAGEPPYRAAFAVAERLGARPVVFPGDHGGFGAQPEAFAARLHEVLSSSVLDPITRHTGPSVLFVCVHNAGRSQMAAGLLHQFAGDRVTVRSAGSAPADEINPAAVQAMAELGIDMSHEFPKPLTEEFVQAADVVITMGCGDACPIYPGKRYEDWEVDDPAGKSVEEVRRIRDDLAARVQALVAAIAPTEGAAG
jgi:protein-tyrosine-phosphatase/pimeloyl-ACP methyl ester carboxylesterase